jgi:hypothetical protein
MCELPMCDVQSKCHYHKRSTGFGFNHWSKWAGICRHTIPVDPFVPEFNVGTFQYTGLFKMIHPISNDYILEVYKYRVISDTSTKRTAVEILSLTL